MRRSEFRYAEVRAEGRTLRGTAMPYGVVSPGHRERFEPGAFQDLSDVRLDVMHDRRRIIARTGAGLELRDSPEALTMVAHLPETREANDALTLVRQKVLRGLSVEFVSIQERYESGIRIIQRAALPALSVVDSGSYPGTAVEARQNERRRRLGTVRGRIPKGRNLSCGCHRGTCSTVNFGRNAFSEALLDDARELLAVRGEFKDGLASRKRGTLQVDDADDALMIWATIPDTTAGRDLLEQMTTTNVVARPFFDPARSDFVEAGGVASYSRVHLRAFILGPTDEDSGWPTIELVPDDQEPVARPARRARVWL